MGLENASESLSLLAILSRRRNRTTITAQTHKTPATVINAEVSTHVKVETPV